MSVSNCSGFNPFCTGFIEESKRLPTFRRLQADGKVVTSGGIWTLKECTDYKNIQLISCEQLQSALFNYFEVMGSLFRFSSEWISSVPTNPSQLYDIENTNNFLPYAQKLVVPPGSRCIFKGDLHGDLHSLVAFIDQLKENGDTSTEDPLKFIKPLYLIFLGDYVDRGVWGLEVIYLLLLLKIKNPDQVFLIRGNHEDPAMAGSLGFKQEYEAKFREEDSDGRVYDKISAFYNSLPVVLYLGAENPEKISFIQCCHGGIEWGYNPEGLLNSNDKRFEMIEEFKRYSQCPREIEVVESSNTLPLIERCEDFKAVNPKHPHPIGFMWNEFNIRSEDPTSFNQTKKIFSCNQALTKATFAAASLGRNILFAAIRAHQHAPNFPHLQNNPLMDLLLEKKGCVKLWNAKGPTDISLEENTVLTLLLSPDSDSGLDVDKLREFTYDTTLSVITATNIEDWKCTITNNEIMDDVHNRI